MEQSNDRIDITRQLIAIRKHWYYYLISIVGALILIALYGSLKSSVYLFHSTILIENKDEAPTPMSGIMQMARSFSVGGLSSSSVDNEMLLFRSQYILKNTVKDLNLNVNYVGKDGIQSKALYKNSPILLSAPKELHDTLSTSLAFKVEYSAGKFNITAKKGILGTTVSELTNVDLPATLKTPYGNFNFNKSSYFNPKCDYDIRISFCNYDVRTDMLSKELISDLSDKKANGISLEYKDANKDRGRDILNKVMDLYNKRRVDQRNEEAIAKINSINNRISEILGELQVIEKGVETFKSNNSITNIDSDVKVLLTENSEYRKEVLRYRSQIEILDMALESLNKNDGSLVPISDGVEASGVISQYNELLMARMTLLQSAKESNASLVSLNERIEATRKSVIKNVKRARQNAMVVLNDLENEKNLLGGKIKQVPQHEREYIGMLRNQTLKNDLYMFLLEKRESAELELSDTAIPGFILDKAYCDTKSDITKFLIFAIILLFLAIVVPTIYIIVKLKIRNKINNRHDIPTIFKPLYITDIADATNGASSNTPDYQNSLKYLRAKLADQDIHQAISITSNSDNDCKARMTLDIAKCLSAADYKVLVVDADSSASCISEQCSNNYQRNGLLGYINNNQISIDSIIDTDSVPNISIICRGNQDYDIEDMLMKQKFNNLITQLKNDYDYILLNCPMASILNNIKSLINNSERIIYIIDSRTSNRKLINKESLILSEYKKMMIVLCPKRKK